MERERAAHDEAASSEGGFSGVVLWRSGSVYPEDGSEQDPSQRGAPVVAPGSAEQAHQHHLRRATSSGRSSANGSPHSSAEPVLDVREDAGGLVAAQIESEAEGRASAAPAAGTPGAAGARELHRQPLGRPVSGSASLHSASSLELAAP